MSHIVVVEIVHGPVETDEDAGRVEQVRRAIDPHWLQSIGQDDRVVFVLAGAGLPALAGAITDHAAPWWRVTMAISPAGGAIN